MEENKDKSIESLDINKDEKWKLKDYIMVALVFGFLAFIAYVLSNQYELREKAQESWRIANEELKEGNKNCEILRVLEIDKSYEPRRVDLSIQYYGSEDIQKLSLPLEIDIPVLSKNNTGYSTYIPILDELLDISPSKQVTFVKVCFNNVGYIETIEKYEMEGVK